MNVLTVHQTVRLSSNRILNTNRLTVKVQLMAAYTLWGKDTNVYTITYDK